MFSSQSFIVLFPTFRSMIRFELIFVYGVKKGSSQVRSFAHGYPVVLAPSVEDTIHFPFSGQLCQRTIDHKCKGLFLDFQFFSIDIDAYSCTSTVLS